MPGLLRTIHFCDLTPSPSVQRLLVWLLATGWPLLLGDVRHALQVYARRLLDNVTHRLRIGGAYTGVEPAYSKYQDRDEEEKYWQSAFRLKTCLGMARARHGGQSCSEIPLVMYYSPPLPPMGENRGLRRRDPEATEYPLSPKAFCKWHRMVFRGPLHPTLKEAKKQIKNYSSRDRQQIFKISRMLSDEEVFGMYGKRVEWCPRYQTMWKEWLQNKGPDVAIVFRAKPSH